MKKPLPVATRLRNAAIRARQTNIRMITHALITEVEGVVVVTSAKSGTRLHLPAMSKLVPWATLANSPTNPLTAAIADHEAQALNRLPASALVQAAE